MSFIRSYGQEIDLWTAPIDGLPAQDELYNNQF